MCTSQRSHFRRLLLIFTLIIVWNFQANLIVAQTPQGTPYHRTGANAAPSPQGDLSLNSGSIREGALKGGETHSHTLMLSAKQCLHAAVEHIGIDVVLILRGPSGNQLFAMDGVVGTVGTEDLVWEATDTGSYTLELQARPPAPSEGKYSLRVELRDSAGIKDRAWMEAQRFLMEGRRAHDDASGEAFQQASKAYRAAVQRWRDAGAQRWEAVTLQYLGVVQVSLGDNEQARDSLEAALLLARALKDRRAEGRILNNLSAVYRNLGDYEKARECVQGALVMWRELRNRRGEAAALNGLGNTYILLNQLERARDYYEQALVISREINDRKFEGVALINLGNIATQLGQLDQALNYLEQALVIVRNEKSRTDEATVLHTFGEVYAKLRQLDKSRDCFTQALEIYRAVKDRSGEASALMNLGIRYLEVNREPLAHDYLEQALSIWREIRDPRSEAAALYQLARLARQKGDLDAAYAQASAALTIIESIRSGVTGQELRSSFLASTQDYFELCIDLLMQMHRRNPKDHRDADALAISERARARSLLDLLTEARSGILAGADQRLVAREKELQRQLNATAAEQQQLLSGTHTPDEGAAIEKKLSSLTGEYQDTQIQLRRTSPRYAALVQPQPLNLQAIQRRLLDKDTLLLVYSLGARRSYLWVVAPDKLSSFELPGREQLEAATRQLRELLAAPQLKDKQSPAGRKPQSRLSQIESTAGSLSRMLLTPVAAQLGDKRLVIVGDGALQYVPFAALPDPAVVVRSRRSLAPPLILGHEIVSLPSASTLAVMRDELRGRPLAAKALAVLADPVFSVRDERIAANSSATVKAASLGLPIAMRDARLPDTNAKAFSKEARGFATGVERGSPSDLVRSSEGDLPRLPFARREAEAIASMAPAEVTMKALDFSASRETATSQVLGQYRIVHFATHGLLNTEHPELSSLVLSLVDEQGRSQDGFLRLHDIYNLHMPVELVVLSACQTGLGKDIRGEGLIGLTRGFMYAGAARVVASLWRVDDVATAELMRRFYGSMLRDGQRPATALRTAQIAMWREGVWRSPYYWAGFVLQGEWK